MELINPHSGGVYVDATVGLGGHAKEILGRIGPDGVLVGLDRDEEALRVAGERLSDGRCVLRKARFSELSQVMEGLGIGAADGVLFDFGASMMQMTEPGRGFSFSSDEPLDMRMDRSQGLTAQEAVNSYPQAELERILREFGEERNARKIARAVVERRRRARITTCRELADLVASVSGRRGRLHPATRTFQALRIEVNDELGEIRRGLEGALGVLRPGGRLVAISYHSLEDRAVKVFMKEEAGRGRLRRLTKKPAVPAREELIRNPSARSAKLRAAEAI
ncbi:MAG: 16S rRNA (cytosine(1402)-N(4))-methyltransferase RsmH [Thermodesulfovibrionales bacterium]